MGIPCPLSTCISTVIFFRSVFRNRLVLTDEDEAEYRSFEDLIQVTKEFSKSSVMLCTFHGIWMAFKKDLITLLDECACGKLLGTCVQFVFRFYFV